MIHSLNLSINQINHLITLTLSHLCCKSHVQSIYGWFRIYNDFILHYTTMPI